MKKDTKENWEERLPKWLYRGAKYKIIVDFIRQEFQSYREELISKIEGMGKMRYHENSAEDEKKMMFNQALSEVIALLKE